MTGLTWACGCDVTDAVAQLGRQDSGADWEYGVWADGMCLGDTPEKAADTIEQGYLLCPDCD